MSLIERKRAMGKQVSQPRNPHSTALRDTVKTVLKKGKLTLWVEGRDSFGHSVAGLSLDAAELSLLIARLLRQRVQMVPRPHDYLRGTMMRMAADLMTDARLLRSPR